MPTHSAWRQSYPGHFPSPFRLVSAIFVLLSITACALATSPLFYLVLQLAGIIHRYGLVSKARGPSYLPGHALRQYLLQDLALFSPVIFDNISTVWRLEIGNVLVAHYEAGRQEVNIIPIRGKQRRFLPWILSVMVSKEVFRVAKRQKVIKLSQEQDKGM